MKLQCYEVAMDPNDYPSVSDYFNKNEADTYHLYPLKTGIYIRYLFVWKQVDICKITSDDIEYNYSKNPVDISLQLLHETIQCVLENAEYLQSVI